MVREKHLCLNCFADGHRCRTCPSKYSCHHCGGRHHSLLHREREQAPVSTPAPVFTAIPTFPTRQAKFLYSASVLLKNGDRIVKARALLDGGASIPIISEHLVTELALPRIHDPIPVTGISGTTQCKFTVSSKLYSLDESFVSDPISFTVIPGLQPLRIPPNRTQLLANPKLRQYHLADPELGGKVDLVLCIENTSDLTTDRPFPIGDLRALPTQLGLCLSGPLSGAPPTPVMIATTPTNLEDDLSRLWELDQVPDASPLSTDEQQAVRQFDDMVNRVGGRFAVSLPRVKDPPLLGDTRRQALSRLLTNEKTLKAKDKLEAFSVVLPEYLTLGHAETVPYDELNKQDSYYLPVHAVVKETSTSTKLRAVFDASARSSTGASLNDTLLPGPSLYPPLVDILTKFRCHAVGVSADITKMFREILLNPNERDWHRFLVRNDSGHIEDCRMLRLTFGVKSSPFLATQVLRTLAEAHSTSHPRASQAILSEFYVDDVLTGADSDVTAYQLHLELYDLLLQAGMTLRKWRTNSPVLRSLIHPDLLEKDSAALTIEPSPDAQKALGIHWDTHVDSFHVAVPKLSPSTSPTTKRVIASGTAGVFDVLGFFCPVIVTARILFQETWKLGVTWDKPLPEEIQERWHNWINDLPAINAYSIPRRLTLPDKGPPTLRSLHGFCDASSVAYGACIYLHTKYHDGTAHTALVLAKARVLPTKGITIPKAELTAAHLLARLLRHVSSLLGLRIDDAHVWSDSQITLHWLPKSPSDLNRFVANRVAAIQALTPPTIWRYVPSAENPADLASRGVRSADLIASSLWWSGPAWLHLLPDQWPPPFLTKPSIPIYTVSIKPPSTPSPSLLSFISRLTHACSSFFTLVRIVSYVCRFIYNCRHPLEQRKFDSLTLDEITHSKSQLYRLSQLESIPVVFSAAVKKTLLPRGHALRHYALRLSDHGHVLALSRVRNPDAPNQPLELCVLSAKSKLTRLLLLSLHKLYGHPGTSTLLAITASSYVMIGLRNHLKLISRTCVICQKALAQPLNHMMGLLPSVRTTPSPPFHNVGVDFAGPLTLRVGHTRMPSFLKGYVVVFVCMSTKSVHLDLCESLSTQDFMATLHRFVNRRGCPARIFSDNGSNFVRAREEIRAIQKMTRSVSFQNAITHCP